MLSSKNRIKKKKEFDSVFNLGKTVSNKNYILKIKDSNRSFPRFAFVVPSRFEKRATKRNRIKRVFREVVRSLLPFIKGGFDIIFIIKTKEEISFSNLQKELQLLFKKIKII